MACSLAAGRESGSLTPVRERRGRVRDDNERQKERQRARSKKQRLGLASGAEVLEGNKERSLHYGSTEAVEPSVGMTTKSKSKSKSKSKGKGKGKGENHTTKRGK